MKNKKGSVHPSFPQKRESSLIEQQWLQVAKQRMNDISSKKVKTIPLDMVFKRIDRLLSK